MVENSTWNSDRSQVHHTLQLGYPLGGVQQVDLAFRLGENVISATKADSMDIQHVSDIIVRSWEPGRTVSSELANADPVRYRRTMMEEDAMIETDERAQAWAKRKLTRRAIPVYFKSIIIDPNHPNAPYGMFDVGDSIFVQATTKIM